jgi:hypothetical protein
LIRDLSDFKPVLFRLGCRFDDLWRHYDLFLQNNKASIISVFVAVVSA